MEDRSRRLDDYFAAARREPGPTEEQVRTLVALAPAPSLVRRWLMLAGIGTLVVGAFFMVDRVMESPQTHTQVRANIAARADRGATQSPPGIIQTRESQEDTMRTGRAATMIAAVAATTMSVAPAAAQEPSTLRSNAPQEAKQAQAEQLMTQFADELGRSAADYWTIRLNDYKVRIDRALSPADLEALTRLRVRFSIFLEENAAVAASVHGDLETESGDGDGKVKEKTTLQMQIGAEGMEVFSLFEQARAISMNYRGDFDNLRETVLDDLIGFFRLVKNEAQQFIRLHEEEVGRLTDGKDVVAELDELENEITELKASQQGMVQMAYGFAIEPLIMLFNGGDVRAIFGPTGIMKGAVTGITLPEQHVLLQCIPNPVSGVASIPYHLDQPSERTLLRVYASTGELVVTQDLGARGSGDHTATVDMSSRAPGVYLYELTIAAPSGQQIYSRRMQVVR